MPHFKIVYKHIFFFFMHLVLVCYIYSVKIWQLSAEGSK